MKKIITTLSTDSISVQDLPSRPVIGAMDTFGNKTLVIMSGYDNPDSYKLLSNNGISMGNSYPKFNGSLKKVLSHELHQYFLFETEKDLFKWLAE